MLARETIESYRMSSVHDSSTWIASLGQHGAPWQIEYGRSQNYASSGATGASPGAISNGRPSGHTKDFKSIVSLAPQIISDFQTFDAIVRRSALIGSSAKIYAPSITPLQTHKNQFNVLSFPVSNLSPTSAPTKLSLVWQSETLHIFKFHY